MMMMMVGWQDDYCDDYDRCVRDDNGDVKGSDDNCEDSVV